LFFREESAAAGNLIMCDYTDDEYNRVAVGTGHLCQKHRLLAADFLQGQFAALALLEAPVERSRSFL
jgi:hypothetical protein